MNFHSYFQVKRERYLAKEALQDAEHVLQKVMTETEQEKARTSSHEVNSVSPVLRKRQSSQDNTNVSPFKSISENSERLAIPSSKLNLCEDHKETSFSTNSPRVSPDRHSASPSPTSNLYPTLPKSSQVPVTISPVQPPTPEMRTMSPKKGQRTPKLGSLGRSDGCNTVNGGSTLGAPPPYPQRKKAPSLGSVSFGSQSSSSTEQHVHHSNKQNHPPPVPKRRKPPPPHV